MSDTADRSLARRLVRPIAGLIVLVVVFVIVQRVREDLGIEWSAESIQAAVKRLGVLAPLGFIGLVLVRQMLALPSVIVMTSAGLLFGQALGTLIGGLGIALNALILFGIARFMGRDWVLPRLEQRFPDFEERATNAGPLFIALTTAHPMGPLTPFYFAAGVTRMSPVLFGAIVLPAALFRAACYAFLGAYILEPSSPQFWIASAVLIAVSLLPLLHPGFRARILRRS